MIAAVAVIPKAQAVLGRPLEADELHMLGRLLKANENDDEKGEDWYVQQLLEAIEYVRQDPADHELPAKAYWVEPKQVIEIE